ncbi:MAG: EamA family transporter, partial [Candidatus Zixiibacteriota bacterium]
MKREIWIPLLMALASAVLFAAATPVSKLLLAQSDPIQLAGLLYLGAAIGVLPVALKKSVREAPPAINRANTWRLTGAILC